MCKISYNCMNILHSLWFRVFIFLVFCLYLLFKGSSDNYDDISEDLIIDKALLGNSDEKKELYIYTWDGYFPHEVVIAFEKITGIKVHIDVFDSNELLEIKLISGKSHYDIVCPSLTPFFGRQMEIGLYQKLDKKLLNFYDDFDPFIIEKVIEVNDALDFALPYFWGVSGFAVNEKRVKEIFPEADVNSLSLVFEEKNLQKISKLNVTFLNSPSEVFPILAHYMFNGENGTDEQLKLMYEKLCKLRKYIFKFSQSATIDLFNGSSAVAFCTSGSVRQMLCESESGDNDIRFVFPKEGAELWIDVLAIPKNAKHLKNAHMFFNYIFSPKVIAYISNRMACANPIVKSKKYIKKDIVNDVNVYPSDEVLSKCFIEKINSIDYDRVRTKLFTKVKSCL